MNNSEFHIEEKDLNHLASQRHWLCCKCFPNINSSGDLFSDLLCLLGHVDALIPFRNKQNHVLVLKLNLNYL